MLTPMERVHDPHLRVFMRTHERERKRSYDLLSRMSDADLDVDVLTPLGRASVCDVLMHMLCFNERVLDAIATSEFAEPRLCRTCENETVKDMVSWFEDAEEKMLSAFETYRGASVTHYISMGKEKVTLVELLEMMLAREAMLYGSLITTLKK